MMFEVSAKQWVGSLLLLAALLILSGCGDTNTANVRNSPPPPETKVSIAFQPAPVTSMQLGTRINFSAVVSNDASKAGVDWSVTCQSSNCGSFTAAHTDSGQPTTYAPPSTLSGNVFTAIIEAFATADHTQNVTSPLTVTAFGSGLQGTFVLQAQGVDSGLQPYQFAAALVLDGNGGITSGEQTVNITDQTLGTLVTRPDVVTGGSYFLGPDGRGTITIKTNDQGAGVSGTETFNLVYLSPSQALISQADSTGSASGTMDLQTNVAGLSGGYAFVVSGMDIQNSSLTAFGGIFNVDSPNTISGTGSISDQNLGGTLTQNQTLSGTVSDPDPLGAVTIDLSLGFATGPVQFTGYIVDARHIKLIETDNTSGTGTSSTGGIAIAQGAATGSFTSLDMFSGNYVFGILGVDFGVGLPSTKTSVGVLTSDGAGNVSGFSDTLFQGNCVQNSCLQSGIPGAQVSADFTGRYTMVLNGIGRARVTPNTFTPAATPPFHPLYIFYLTGNGSEAAVLDAGDLNVAQNYASLGAGIAYPQSAPPFPFTGGYGFSLTQQNGAQLDGTGQWVADPNTKTLSGFMDTGTASGSLVGGSFASAGPDGRFAVDLSGSGFAFTSPSTSTLQTNFYAIDSTRGFFVETDLTDPTSPSSTVSLGYYAARTPLCTGCP